jgi:UDP-N-acetylmuramoylalanine--D-glutamate ligase
MIGSSVLVFGTGLHGVAVAAALTRRGHRVVALDDRPSPEAAEELAAVGVELQPAGDDLTDSVAEVDAVIPTPGLPESHRLFDAIAQVGRPVLSELDLAAVWDSRPIVAITGTNGKTTVTMMVDQMLQRSGITSVACGNTEVPLVVALDDPTVDVFVVEASSFRLARSRHVAPWVGTWLNFAPDHLDVHRDLAAYEAAKARIFAEQGPDQTAVANSDDEVVMTHARRGRGRLVTFGAAGDYRVEGDRLVGPGWSAAVADLPRSLPHDLANALAAVATARAAGATEMGIAEALAGFQGLPHRMALVGEAHGVRWYDDSKATTPHATAAAVSGLGSVVLIAGGRNKGVDLSVLGSLAPPVRAVVGIGEAADAVVAAFAGLPTVTAASMADAVRAAAGLARPGDAVVLSPGCASYDWYSGYAERGADFARIVVEEVLR